MGLRVTTILSGLAGGPHLSTMNFAGTTELQAENAALAVRAFWNGVKNEFHSAQSANVQDEVLVYDDITGDPVGLYQVDGGEPVIGGSGGEVLPYTTQFLVRWRTGVYDNGREIRGRTFIPGATEAQNENGRPTVASQGAITTAAIALIANADTALGVYSKKAGATAVVVAASTWSEFASLRSRRD